MKHLEGKTRSTTYATFCTPERYLSMFKVLYVCQYGCIFSVVNCELVGPVFFNLSVFRSADRNFTQNGKKIKLNFLIFIFR